MISERGTPRDVVRSPVSVRRYVPMSSAEGP